MGGTVQKCGVLKLDTSTTVLYQYDATVSILIFCFFYCSFESYYLSKFSFSLLWLRVWYFHVVFLWSEDGNSSLQRKIATTIRCASCSFEWTLQAGGVLVSNILINCFPKHQNLPQNYGWSSVWEWDKSLQRVEAVSPPRLAQLLSSCCCYVVWYAAVLQHTRVWSAVAQLPQTLCLL